ncbi:MAG: hypothetical protein ACRCTA_06690 [Bacilli bacterium]
MTYTNNVSELAYEIENLLHAEDDLEDIRDEISKHDEYDDNLYLIDAFYDKTSGTSGCAFLDKTTGDVIVGFAGTNSDNGLEQTLKDYYSDVSILAHGIPIDLLNKNASFLFLLSLSDRGHKVTQITGHSLGGQLATFYGIICNIPLIVTYNSAPLFINPMIYNALKKPMDAYTGKALRFVSQEDPLNIISDGVSGYYFGEKFMIYNRSGHSMSQFLKASEQAYIDRIIALEMRNVDGKSGFKIDIDNDGKVDISLTESQIKPFNLFGNSSSGMYDSSIIISPDTLRIFADNLFAIKYNDLTWINSAIKLCEDKNNDISSKLTTRHDDLCRSIMEILDEALLSKLLMAINDSFGYLEENIKKLDALSLFSIDTIISLFKEEKNWFIDGDELNVNDLKTKLRSIKENISILKHNLSTTGDFKYNTGYENKYTLMIHCLKLVNHL